MKIDFLNYKNYKKVYLIGIKGVGMTALAQILKRLKVNIVGSDVKEKFFTNEVLSKEKIKVYEGFSKKNIQSELPIDLVIASVAYFQPEKEIKNPEVKFALSKKIPLITYPQALASIFNQSFGIAVCGSHGKSSTTAILGKIFKDAQLEPTVLVGSEVIEWKSNGLVGKNFLKKIDFLNKNIDKSTDLEWIRKNLKHIPLFIIEADEYREAFLNYQPRIILITNIDYDHPDYFKNEKKYVEAYRKFIFNLKLPKILILHKKDKKFDIVHNSKDIRIFFPQHKKPFPFPIKGNHFQENLQLVYELIKILKIPKNKFLSSIKNYRGIKRRFEIVFHRNDCYFIDDYAHHPTEVWSFYQSLRQKFPSHRITVIFQPHTFTRTHFLFDNFVKVFKNISKDKNLNLVIFKTFPSAREKELISKISNLKKDKDLAQKVKCQYIDEEKELIDFLRKEIIKNKEKKYIIATVGAGDLNKIFLKIKN